MSSKIPHFALELSVNKPELKALYSRVGEAKLGEILRDFYRRMSTDVLLGFYFDGKDLDAIAAKQQEFLMRAMGAIPSYTGKAPAQAHEKLAPIQQGHFDRRLKVLEATLRDHGVSEEDIRTWMGFENAFRDAVVNG